MTPDMDALIRHGRACVRLIEAAEVLLQMATDINQQETYSEAIDLTRWQLRDLVRDLDPAVTSQIMAASDKRLGTVGDVGLN
jgi:hypothetical protein